MKLYQLEDGTLINLDQLCAIEPVNHHSVEQTNLYEWELILASGQAYALTLDDARNLMDTSLLGFEFMAE